MDALQVIAEPRRRRILAIVWDDELAAGEIAEQFDVSFAAISQHLSVLKDAGMVTMRKDGNRRLYRADQDVLAPFKPMLEAMWTDTLGNLAAVIEQDLADG